MRSIGLATIFMYLASLGCFLFAMLSGFLLLGAAFGALFFIAATVILASIVRKRADRQDF
ncbi:MAG: hypothetical protein ACR2GD_14275 [Pyrinomonadaceae bacterium]